MNTSAHDTAGGWDDLASLLGLPEEPKPTAAKAWEPPPAPMPPPVPPPPPVLPPRPEPRVEVVTKPELIVADEMILAHEPAVAAPDTRADDGDAPRHRGGRGRGRRRPHDDNPDSKPLSVTDEATGVTVTVIPPTPDEIAATTPADGSVPPTGDAPGEEPRRKRRRRRRKKKGPGEAGPTTAGATGAGEAEDADDTELEHGDDPAASDDDEDEDEVAVVVVPHGHTAEEDIIAEMVANWNVPTWQDIIAGLHKPS